MSKENKVIEEKDRMCLAQAFVLLHKMHRVFAEQGYEDCAEALDVLFHWIDEMSMLLRIVNGDLDGDD